MGASLVYLAPGAPGAVSATPTTERRVQGAGVVCRVPTSCVGCVTHLQVKPLVHSVHVCQCALVTHLQIFKLLPPPSAAPLSQAP